MSAAVLSAPMAAHAEDGSIWVPALSDHLRARDRTGAALCQPPDQVSGGMKPWAWQ